MPLKRHLKQIHYDGLLYITNHFVNRVPSHTFRLWYYRSIMRCEIGAGSYIFMGAWFDSRGGFRMGRDCTINQRCRLDSRGGISIGDNVSISAEVAILTADHDPQSVSFESRLGEVVIERDVFVGTRAMILPSVIIGRGAVVAAGAVVTKSVEPFAIVAGTPARKIGERRQDIDYRVSYCRLFS